MNRRQSIGGDGFKNLRAFREARDLSQRECGQMVDVSQITWSRWERRLRYPPRDKAKMLAKITGVPLEILLGLSVVLLGLFGSCL